MGPPATTTLGGGGCPIETPRFFLNFLGTFGNSLVKIRPFGLLACCCLLLLAMAQTTTNIQKCWGAWPPATTPLGGWLPPRNPSIFLNFLGTCGNSLVKIRPFGLLACCCLLLTAACHGPNNPQHSKMLGGGLGPPATTPLGGWLPHRNPSIFLNFLGTFGNSLVKIRPFGLLACWPAAACCSLLLAMAQTTTNIQKCWGAWPPSHHPPRGVVAP